MKISIIYFSQTGNTGTMAAHVAAGASTVAGTEVECFNVAREESWDRAFIEESDAVIFGTPVYYANMSWQLKKWFDTRGSQYKLAGKLGAAFATENCPHGGGELAIMTIYNHLLVLGMLVYSGGAALGAPFIHVGPTIVREQMEERAAICHLFGQRIAAKAHELFAKK